MHIYNTTADGRAMVSLPVEWTKVVSEDQVFGVLDDGVHKSADGIKPVYFLSGEFRWVHGDDTYRAVRNRTEYGWCHWHLYKNGVKTSHSGDLPERMQVYVPVEVAKADGCKCGCTSR